MKYMKKIMSLIMTLTMILAMTVIVSADNSYTITVKKIENEKDNIHSYEAYQIFTGDLSESILSNIKWGTGVTKAGQTEFGDAAQKAATLTNENAEAFANDLTKYLTSTKATSTFTNGNYEIKVTEPGYYLVKDSDSKITDGSYTKYVLEVVKSVSVTPKTDTPKVEKKVQDLNDSDSKDDTNNAWLDAADHDIGDTVPFKLTATLPAGIDNYKSYAMTFKDTLSKGLSFDSDSIKVYVNDTEVTSGFRVDTKDNQENGTEISISFDNVKSYSQYKAKSENVVRVEYTADLNSDAVIGSAGNPNTVYLTYTNNPNQSGEGKPDEGGQTPEDKVIVFTYKTIINKKMEDKTSDLEGAGFTLYKQIPGHNDADEDGWVKLSEIKPEDISNGSKFEFKGIDDGQYKLEETTTPDGYNTMTPITFEVKASHVDGDEPYLDSLSGEKISGDITFSRVTDDEDALSADVINQKGSTLPSTGGMGTKIFYTLGAILVVGAGVLLITRKRMTK